MSRKCMKDENLKNTLAGECCFGCFCTLGGMSPTVGGAVACDRCLWDCSTSLKSS